MLVNEIFHSLQGEGANTGRAAVFVRLAGCNLACPYCDTDFAQGKKMSLEEIARSIEHYPTRFLIWTGGEPTLQLTEEATAYFHRLGYYQAIETNGTRPVPKGIDYISCSPKPEAIGKLKENFPDGVGEFRFPLGSDTPLPPPIDELPTAQHYLVSPIFAGDDAMEPDPSAITRSVEFVKAFPAWRLSIQMHKLIHIP